MTRQQRANLAIVTWPVVAMAGMFLASFTGVFWLSTPEGRTAILGLLMTSSTSLVMVSVQRVATRIDQVLTVISAGTK